MEKLSRSISREVWVKANQKNAMQQGWECGVGRLYKPAPCFQSGLAGQSRTHK